MPASKRTRQKFGGVKKHYADRTTRKTRAIQRFEYYVTYYDWYRKSMGYSDHYKTERAAKKEATRLRKGGYKQVKVIKKRL